MQGKKLVLSAAASALQRFARLPSAQRILFNSIRLNRSEITKLLVDPDLRFLTFCFARRDWSHSQIMQDLWVCFELGEKYQGYFVEFGATNGKKNSNTWLLEKRLGWSGILAEPNTFWHEALHLNRSAHIEHLCVSSASGQRVSFFTTDDSDPELSAIADFADEDHFAEVRSKAPRVEIETISLDDLLDKYQAPEVIDYMSVDTEGSELDILSAYSFRRRPRLISVENNHKTEKPLQALLESKGYERVFKPFSQWDGWYALRDGVDRSVKPILAPDL
jgi:FkbM family methyltransferase